MQSKNQIIDCRQKTYHEKIRNYEHRPTGSIIDTIVIHYTAGNFPGSYNTLMQARSVSAHYLIDTDGEIFWLVSDEEKAWHAGISHWRNKDFVNNFSIGIGLVNTGSKQALNNSKLVWQAADQFPPAQMTALCNLIDKLKVDHRNITDQNIIGHSDVSDQVDDSKRKIDPGVFFDWKFLAKQGHGLYPKRDVSSINVLKLYADGDTGIGIANLQKNLNAYGYKVCCTGEFDHQTRNAVRAFNMHFHNDIQYDGFTYESWDTISEMRLQDLLEQTRGSSADLCTDFENLYTSSL